MEILKEKLKAKTTSRLQLLTCFLSKDDPSQDLLIVLSIDSSDTLDDYFILDLNIVLAETSIYFLELDINLFHIISPLADLSLIDCYFISLDLDLFSLSNLNHFSNINKTQLSPALLVKKAISTSRSMKRNVICWNF